MTSVSEFTASRIDCRKNFSNPSRMSGVTGVWHTLSALSLFSRAEERTGSYTGRDGTGERSYVSARHETRSLSRCDSHARVRLPCKVSRLRSAAPASGGTPWQEAHLIRTPLSIYVGYRPMRMLCLLRRGEADTRRQPADAPPTDESENRPLFEKRAPEKTATSRSACSLYAARTTAIFG